MIFTSNPPPEPQDFSALPYARLIKRLAYNQNQIRQSVRDGEHKAVRDLTEDQNLVVAEIARRARNA